MRHRQSRNKAGCWHVQNTKLGSRTGSCCLRVPCRREYWKGVDPLRKKLLLALHEVLSVPLLCMKARAEWPGTTAVAVEWFLIILAVAMQLVVSMDPQLPRKYLPHQGAKNCKRQKTSSTRGLQSQL